MKNRKLSDIESEIGKALRAERKNLFEIGALLIEARAKVDHGGWLPWLEKNFGKSERTAQNYMMASEWREKNATVANLKLRPSAIYDLASYRKSLGGHFCSDVSYHDVREAVEAEVFKRAKTQWVDSEDFRSIFQQKAWVEAKRRKAKQSPQPEPEPEPKPSDRRTAAEILDGPPPALPPIGAPPPLPRDAKLFSNLVGTVNNIYGLRTISAEKFVGADVSVERLEFCSTFLHQIAEAKRRKVAA
jgi:hypothetical protein